MVKGTGTQGQVTHAAVPCAFFLLKQMNEKKMAHGLHRLTQIIKIKKICVICVICGLITKEGK